MFVSVGVPTCPEVYRNLMYRFMCRTTESENVIITALTNPVYSSCRFSSELWKHWRTCLQIRHWETVTQILSFLCPFLCPFMSFLPLYCFVSYIVMYVFICDMDLPGSEIKDWLIDWLIDIYIYNHTCVKWAVQRIYGGLINVTQSLANPRTRRGGGQFFSKDFTKDWMGFTSSFALDKHTDKAV